MSSTSFRRVVSRSSAIRGSAIHSRALGMSVGMSSQAALINLTRVQPFAVSQKFLTTKAGDATEQVIDAEVEEETTAQKEEKKFLAETEVVQGEAEQSSFQAETSKLLEIVAKSLYTDKEVFLRELISNASDAIEKLRYFSIAHGGGLELGELKIEIAGDEDLKTITIRDTGIGMTRDELKENLGTIARSGSLAFVKELEGANASSSDAASSIIGRFGVGFYSAFMVGNSVKVYSRSAKGDDKGYCWSSDGSGKFSLAEASGVERGTKIIIHLRPDCEMFASKNYIKSIVEKYSNFVSYDILVNGTKIKKVEALWMKDPKSVTEEEHREFYRFISNSYDSPLYQMMFRTDAPVSIKSTFYVPQMHTEKYGMGRMEIGVNLYSRKVLIKAHCKELLPEWLRFLKGAVDSEDIPLNISRENMQDSTLMRKLNGVLTKRVLKWLYDESQTDPAKFNQFFKEFGHFLKEGCVTALQHKEGISKLLRFESSKTETGQMTSLEEYVKRMGSEQKNIYYLCVPNRQYALSSPYYEAFKDKDVEVLFLYQTIDDFVVTNLFEFDGKKMISAESSDVEYSRNPAEETKLTDERADALAEWIQSTLSEHVTAVKASSRLVTSPAVITDHESAAMRRMMKMVEGGQTAILPKQKMEINTSHELVVLLDQIRYSNPDLAVAITKQIYDNALVAAGLLDDPRSMLPRINELMTSLLKRTSQLGGLD